MLALTLIDLPLFPTGYTNRPLQDQIGGWRDDASGPMQVVSGPIGYELNDQPG